MLLSTELTGDGKPKKLSAAKLRDRIVKLYDHKKSQTSKWRAKVVERRNRYYLDHYDEEPAEGEEQVHLAHEMRLVDTAHNLLMMEPPRIKAYKQRESGKSLEQGDELEAWLRGLLHLQVLRGRLDPWDMFARDLLTTGMGVLSTYWDINIPLEECPIVFVRRDPLNIFAQEGSTIGRWRWVIHAQNLPILDVEEEWGVVLKEHRSKTYVEKLEKPVEVLDVWSRERDPDTGEMVVVNAVVTKGQQGQFLKNPAVMEHYKYLPFEIAFCIPTPSDDWLRKGLPITAAIEKTVPELQSARNANMRMVKLYSQMGMVYEGVGKVPQVAKGFGIVNKIKPGEKFGFAKWPGTPPDAYVIERMLEGEIAAGGLGQPLMGLPPASASGYAIELGGEAGTLKMIAPTRGLQIALANSLQQACSLMGGYAADQSITIFSEYQNEARAYALTGADCQGWFLEVEIAARFPQDKARDQAMGIQLANSPQRVLDMRHIIQDFLHYDNVDQVQERILIEMAEQNPDVLRYMLMKALDDRGMLEYIQAIEGQQQPGQEPGAQPSAPGIPVLGVSTQTAPQELLGAQRSQELGIGPKGRLFPEQQMEEMLGGPASPVM